MPLKLSALAISVGALAVAGIAVNHARNSPSGRSSESPIRATLESVVPAHNDLWFRYVLENQTDSEYRVSDESEIRILGRRGATSMLEPLANVSGEFPLVVPARSRVHFALIWTGGQEIDPVRVSEAIRRLALLSFVVIDNSQRYRIEFPLS